MKKIILILAVVGSVALASCDTKQCRCYEYNGTRWVRTDTYILADRACRTMNTNTYQCDEMSDPVIDPNDIGEDYKKLKIEN